MPLNNAVFPRSDEVFESDTTQMLGIFLGHVKTVESNRLIANVRPKIQIVDTHELLGNLINIDVAAGAAQFNRTLVDDYG